MENSETGWGEAEASGEIVLVRTVWRALSLLKLGEEGVRLLYSFSLQVLFDYISWVLVEISRKYLACHRKQLFQVIQNHDLLMHNSSWSEPHPKPLAWDNIGSVLTVLNRLILAVPMGMEVTGGAEIGTHQGACAPASTGRPWLWLPSVSDK